ncbi:MAG: MCE family protein [Bacteroidia bacterium]|nr:MCE family protein [Bacteroidia bacterium]
MKINNETKIGILTTISIAFLVLGYNYLSGKGSFFSRNITLHSIYTNASGLAKANPVLLNGFKVGSITEINIDNKTLAIRVDFDITEDIKIPKSSVARIISSDLFGSKAIELQLGAGTDLAKDGDELRSDMAASITDAINSKLDPISIKINSVLGSLDTLLKNKEIDAAIANLSASLRSFRQTTDNLNSLISENKPRIASIISSTESIATNLKNNNQKINSIVDNLEKTSQNLAALNLKETVDRANAAMGTLGSMLDKINKGEGTLGQLVNDKSLYDSLTKTAQDLDAVIKDLNKFPAKYIPIPFTKGQRKKAMEASDKANGN